MKREIKFRAWDEEGGMMHPPFTINEICEIRKEGGGIGAILMNFNWDQLMWLQFTGLHDKNGKEIYEGDIIDDKFGIYKVVFVDGYYAACCLNNSYLPYKLCEYITDSENIIEVVGNVFENPELLNS